MSTLICADELLLLALDNTTGAVHNAASMALDFALTGAVLADLSLNNRLTVSGKHLIITNPAPLGHAVLDAALEVIGGSAKPRSAQDWVNRLPRALALRQRLLENLVARGMLEQRKEKILLIFPTTRYPERDGAAEASIRDRIDSVLRHGMEPDDRTRMLIHLLKAANLIDALYERAERKAIKQRIEALSTHGGYSHVIEKAVADSQAAVLAAIMAASIASTTAAITASTTSCS